MMKPQAMISPEDRRRVAQQVAAAEAMTSAEIVPVIAGSSGRYDRPEDLVGLWGAIAGVLIAWQFLPRQSAVHGTGDWGQVWQMEWHAGVLVAALVAGFVLGAMLASRITWLRRLCTTTGEMQAEVAARSSQVFFDQRVHHAAGNGGLLLYISLYERMARVSADRLVLEKLGQPALDDLCAKFSERLAKGGPVSALCETIEEAGRLLASVLPREAGDVNELPDALVVMEAT